MTISRPVVFRIILYLSPASVVVYHLRLHRLHYSTVSDTLVIQSHRDPLPYEWLQSCLDSVRIWAELNCFDYRFIGDELFDPLDAGILQRTKKQIVIATDLARLFQIQQALARGYQTVIWCDADFLIFHPQRFELVDAPYALGREVWIQENEKGRLKAYVRVHNAFLMFRQGNPFLAFYLDTAQRLLDLNTGRMPPQFIGPKLLSALHNICQCPIQETAGMLSPLLIKSILQDEPSAFDLFSMRSSQLPAAANLCGSSLESGEVSSDEMQQLIIRLFAQKLQR